MFWYESSQWNKLQRLYEKDEKEKKRVISISNIIIPKCVIKNIEDCMFLPAEITDLKDASYHVIEQVGFRPSILPELSSKKGGKDNNYTLVCILLSGVDLNPTLRREDFEALKRTSAVAWDYEMIGMPITAVCDRKGGFAGFLPRKPYLR